MRKIGLFAALTIVAGATLAQPASNAQIDSLRSQVRRQQRLEVRAQMLFADRFGLAHGPEFAAMLERLVLSP